MGSHDINRKFIEILEKKVPKKNELVNILGDILMVDKRTLYRRLNNEIPFTLPEVYLIAKYFHISMDNIFSSNDYSPFQKRTIIDNLYESYIKNGINQPDTNYYRILKKVVKQPYSEQCRVLNMPSIVQLTQHPYLAATISMYYAYRNGQQVSFEDFRVKDIDQYNEKMLEICRVAQSCDYSYNILGPSMGENIAIIIKYLERLGLINRSVVEKIKGELFSIIEHDKEITITGKYPLTGKKCDIYISNTPVESNYSYVWSEDYFISVFVMYTLELFISEEADTFNRMRRWIETQKKNSTLITGTGEYERINFFRKQENIVDAL